MKIALAQLNYHIGNFAHNTQKIIAAIGHARAEGAELIVFSELAVCGYPPLDLLESPYFLEQCEEALKTIAEASQGIAVLIGAPLQSSTGKGLYNAAYLLKNGRVVETRNKTLLPTYDVFDEHRYFESNNSFEVITFEGVRIALTICEDLWNLSPNPLYALSPLDALIKQNPDVIINLAASPFARNHHESRKKIFQANASHYNLPLINVNQVGANTDLIFDGGSLVYAANGELISEMAYFKEDLRLLELTKTKDGCTLSLADKAPSIQPGKAETQRIHEALVLGIRDYFQKSGFKKAVIGLSGGIDSALTVALASEALGAENVHTLLMPSQYSSQHSINDSIELCENYGVSYDVIDIRASYDTFLQSLEPVYKNTSFGLAEENLQARIRGVLLMAYSNKFGHILLNTSNKSELSVGYGTLYGDMAGGIAVLGDVLKTDVYRLCRNINNNRTFIPQNILSKAPSAELRPDQKDSDSLPEYDVLDDILETYIERRTRSNKHPKELVDKVLRLVHAAEYKRFQAPPVLRISNKAFGRGRQMPLVARY